MKLIPVYIVWHDAASMDSWEDIAKVRDFEPHQIHTLGFLVSENENKIVVCLSIDINEDGASQVLTIPKSWILQLKKLKVKL